MSIMEMIDEYIDLKIEGEPASSEWRSIDSNYAAKLDYRDRLRELRNKIDAAMAQSPASGAAS